MVAIEWAIKGLRLSCKKTKRDINSKGLIARKEFKESITMNNLGIMTMQRFERVSITKQLFMASIAKVVLYNLEPMRQVQLRIREELDSNSEEEDDEDYDRRYMKSSKYKIKVDIADFLWWDVC